jgi:hypothetical protein
VIKCRHCKEPFEPAARNQKYCGPECKEIAAKEGVKRRYAAQKAQLKAEREAASRKPNQEVLETAAKAKKKKMSYGEYVHKYEPRKEPKKEVKPVESICDTCPVKKRNNGAKSCNRWARDFARKWREIQRRAGVHIDGKADQSVA